jgi:hypothetical protein
MEPDLRLTDHLNGLIMLAQVSWQCATGGYAQAARIIRRIAEAQQTAVRDGRTGRPIQLHITKDDLSK